MISRKSLFIMILDCYSKWKQQSVNLLAGFCIHTDLKRILIYMEYGSCKHLTHINQLSVNFFKQIRPPNLITNSRKSGWKLWALISETIIIHFQSVISLTIYNYKLLDLIFVLYIFFSQVVKLITCKQIISSRHLNKEII